MDNNTEILNEQPTDEVYELGQWMGRKQAFSLVAGKTAAADVECLRHIREKKLYAAKASIGPISANSMLASLGHMPTG